MVASATPPFVRIAVDAMGGDHAPKEIVLGSLEALAEFPDVAVTLVGRETVVREFLPSPLPERVTIVNAEDVVAMDDKSTSRSAQTSLAVGVDLVKHGQAAAFFSAGSTGAFMANAVLRAKKIKKIDRPGIPIPFPTLKGRAVLVDAGANIDCKPKHLFQFAIMGAIFAESILGIANPRVALLSNGEEPTKGNELVLATAELLRASKLNFVGNVEANTFFSQHADVVVCDGFVGNIFLKAVEGVGSMILSTIAESLRATSTTDPGGGANAILSTLKKRLDYAEYGGMPLLGVNGTFMIGHGSSKARAVKNGIRSARDMVQARVTEKIATDIDRLFE